jgi:RNA polymerase sigma factor (sigma-70 family)
VQKSRSNPEVDFAAFATSRWNRLVKLMILMGCKADDAEDIVQITLERCLLNWKKVNSADDIDAYVARIAINTLRSHQRKRSLKTVSLTEMEDRDGTDFSNGVVLSDAIRRSLDDLSPAHRAVLVLRHFYSLTELQTAAALSIPVGTVKSRLHRASIEFKSNFESVEQETK